MEQRRAQRYKLHLPLHIIHLGGECVDRVEQTRDISSGGVCFLSPTGVAVGEKIEYLITLSCGTPAVRIRCLGKVLRSQQPVSSQAFEVAVTMDRYRFVRADEPAAVIAQ